MPLTTQPFAHLKELDHIADNVAGMNISHVERVGSALAGGVLIALGLARRSPGTLLASLAGGWLVYRGLSGKCPGYQALDINTATHDRGVRGNHGVKVERSIRIHRQAHDLFDFWRNLENVPQFMGRVKSVTPSSSQLSHWIAEGPGGLTFEWDAEIINEHPGTMIAWQSLPGAEMESAGSVWFTPHGDCTDVKLSMQFHPPVGTVGDVAAKMIGDWPARQLEEDLARLKQLIEV